MAFLHDGNETHFVIYQQESFFSESFLLLTEMRSKGILCDVILKVNINKMYCLF